MACTRALDEAIHQSGVKVGGVGTSICLFVVGYGKQVWCLHLRFGMWYVEFKGGGGKHFFIQHLDVKTCHAKAIFH
jgi:hypothetical protein